MARSQCNFIKFARSWSAAPVWFNRFAWFTVIKAMFDDHGELLKVATPSMPVAVLGLSDVPAPGDLFRVVPSDREARLIVAQRKLDQKAASAKPEKTMSLEQVFAKFQAGEAKELALIVKADVQGSLEPIVGQLEKLTVGTGPRVNVLIRRDWQCDRKRRDAGDGFERHHYWLLGGRGHRRPAAG